jgi:hypothetical protein
MTKKLETRLKIQSWDENPYRELPDGSKFTKAEVKLGGDDAGIESAGFEALMHYTPEGRSTYLSLMHVEGTLDGKAGSFVLEGRGTYDGTTARGEYAVIEGSGTGELAGIAGKGASSSTHEDYPNMPFSLEYDLG